MAKKQSKQQQKREQQAIEAARRMTPGKLARLFGKSLLFALVVTVVVFLGSALGVPGIDRWWGQLIVLFVIYLLAYPFLMREFRPRTYLEDERGK